MVPFTVASPLVYFRTLTPVISLEASVQHYVAGDIILVHLSLPAVHWPSLSTTEHIITDSKLEVFTGGNSLLEGE